MLWTRDPAFQLSECTGIRERDCHGKIRIPADDFHSFLLPANDTNIAKMIPRIRLAWLALFALLVLLPAVFAQDVQSTDDSNSDSSTESSGNDDIRYVRVTGEDGKPEYLADNRRPALYTDNFGDCLGNSAVNVSRFDAAYYRDNMTIMFHLAGDSAIANESVMFYIGVFAYGEARFDLTFNPCAANIDR